MSGYPHELKYFMWPWQVHFNIGCQVHAEGVFLPLDRGLNPKTFLVGFLQQQRQDRLPICIEPENLDYQVDEFANIKFVADEVYRADPSMHLSYTGKGVQKKMNNRHRDRVFQLAIEKTLNNSPNNKGNLCFASKAVSIAGFSVYLILELNKIVYESHIHLRKTDSDGFVEMPYSLLESLKDIYLEARFLFMNLPSPGENHGESFAHEEMIRQAAKRFINTVAWKASGGKAINVLFDMCNRLSIATYEQSENFGELIISRIDNPYIEMEIEIEEPFFATDSRKMIKLLQMTNVHASIITDADRVYGLGKISSTYNKELESIFRVKFNGALCWDLLHQEQSILEVKFSNPQFKTEAIDNSKFESNTRRIFQDISESQIKNLYNLAMTVSQIGRGSQIIISSAAYEESERLKHQCIKIKPTRLTPEWLSSMTLIDGGILVDVDGVVFAIGVILDGVANKKGNSARGSRYNSALRYHEYFKKDLSTMIIVVSDDGMIDIIPDLLPQISHDEIVNVIGILEEMRSNSDTFNRSTFYNAMEWLRARKFYLTASECQLINELRDNLDEQDKKNGRTIWQVFDDLTPNSEMNESYYVSY